VARAREGTPARQKAFLAVHPPQQKFTKTDLSKFVNSWNQRPHLVSRGGEKNFREFTIQLKEKSVTPDETYFRRLVAQAILFKRTEKIVQDLNLGGYRANVVTYTIALLAKLTEGGLDLEAIWKAQDIAPTLAKFLGALAKKVHAIVISPPGNANITEWCKKEQCWNAVRGIKVDVPAGVLAPPPQKRAKKKAAAKDDEDDDGETISNAEWLALSTWAASNPSFPARERHALTAITALVSGGRKPSGGDLTKGLELLERARKLGFEHEK
jgi:hypothetical protein